jgi:hypothetical protein
MTSGTQWLTKRKIKGWIEAQEDISVSKSVHTERLLRASLDDLIVVLFPKRRNALAKQSS